LFSAFVKGRLSGSQSVGGTVGRIAAALIVAEGGQLTAVIPGEAVYGTSYVSPLVELFGDVYIGERSFVAGNTVLCAAPDRRLDIGSETNAQDNIIVC
jgi:hypothetical protein